MICVLKNNAYLWFNILNIMKLNIFLEIWTTAELFPATLTIKGLNFPMLLNLPQFYLNIVLITILYSNNKSFWVKVIPW